MVDINNNAGYMPHYLEVSGLRPAKKLPLSAISITPRIIAIKRLACGAQRRTEGLAYHHLMRCG